MTDETMRALVKREPGRGMSLETRPIPEPKADEVRLRVRSVGIDGGAEALIYDWHPSKRHYASDLPQLFGHEFAGEVESVGAGVSRVAPGDRVAVEPALTCGECRNCRDGRFNVCESDDRKNFGLHPDVDGALAEYAVVPAKNVYPFGDSLSYDEGTFLELLGLGVHGLERSSFRPGDAVAVSGPGSVGMSALVAAKAGGASSVAMLGTDADADSRLPIAAEMGATQTVNVESESLDGEFDVFVEGSGATAALETAVEHTRKGGEVVQIGLFHDVDAVPVDLDHLVRSEIDLRTVYARRNASWRRAIAIAEDVDLSPVVGPAFDFEDYEAGFDAVRERSGIKVTLHP